MGKTALRHSFVLGTVLYLGFFLAAAMLMGLAATANASATYSLLYSFGGKTNDGQNPFGSLVELNGDLYGTTFHGGSNTLGAVFQYDPSSGTETPIDLFPRGVGQLAVPGESLLPVGSTLYGLAQGGNSQGAGGIFSYTPSTSAYDIDYLFAGSPSDAGYPLGSLIQSGQALYGATNLGGKNADGALFSYNLTTKTESLLYSFKASTTDVAYPSGTPVLDGSMLYGTSQDDGAYGYGAIYQYNLTTNTESLLYSFNPSNHSAPFPYPDRSLLLSGTALYGASGGGTNGDGYLFKYDLVTNQMTDLYNFSGTPNDGSDPAAPILSGSALYGITYGGGGDGDGTVYAFNLATNQESVLYSFTGGTTDGSSPEDQLLQVGNTLYGATFQGGTYSDGTLFSVTVPEPSTGWLVAVFGVALACRTCRFYRGR